MALANQEIGFHERELVSSAFDVRRKWKEIEKMCSRSRALKAFPISDMCAIRSPRRCLDR